MSIPHIIIGMFLTAGLFSQPPEPPSVFKDYAPTVEMPQEIATLKPVPASPATASLGGASGCTLDYIGQHESGGNYSTNTGNGYYGKYQYSQSTWNNYGGYSTADQAPPSVQDERAAADLAAGKQSQWSVC